MQMCVTENILSLVPRIIDNWSDPNLHSPKRKWTLKHIQHPLPSKIEGANFFSQDIREARAVRFHLICKAAGLVNINMLISFQKTNQVPSQNKETYMGFYESVILLISI